MHRSQVQMFLALMCETEKFNFRNTFHMTQLVTITRENGIADVRLNRADKYNALSPDMFRAIADSAKSLQEDKQTRVVVLSGEGRGFCAGLDFGAFQSMADSGPKSPRVIEVKQDPSSPNLGQGVAVAWRQLPMPVIAAMHGVAYGGGLQIALGADIRIAAPDARLSVFEINWGLIPDMGITQTLRGLMPLDVAKELTLTGRTVSGAEAAELGLVTRVAENPLEAAMELAKSIARHSPDAVRGAKKLLEESWHLGTREGLGLEQAIQSQLIGSPNQLEAVKAGLSKQPAKYADASIEF